MTTQVSDADATVLVINNVAWDNQAASRVGQQTT